MALRRRDLLLLFAIAVVPRMAGLFWGGIDSDENFGRGAKILSGQILIEPSYYPPLKDYLNAAAYALMFVVGRLLGIWDNLAAFRNQYFTDPAPFIAAARSTTVLAAAALAPAAALAAGRAGLGRRGAWITGLVLALYPLNVLVAHTNRTYDLGLCTALMLTVWATGRKFDEPDSLAADLWLGLTTALAASCKQSAVFVLAPLYLALLVVLVRTTRVVDLLRSLARIAAVMVPAWVILNLATLVHLREYLEYQEMLRMMWTRPLTPDVLRQTILPGLLSLFQGGTAPVVILGLLTPLWARHRLILCAWFAGWAGLVLTMFVCGSYQGRLYMPVLSIIGFVAAAGAATLLAAPRPTPRILGAAFAALLLAFNAAGTLEIVRQALRLPIQARVDQAITANAQPESTRILISSPCTDLPVSQAARLDTRERHERLARKYDIDLGPWAEEHSRGSGPGGYFITGMPWAIGGLEHVSDADVAGKVKPFSWPIQPEEWDLDYWVARGYTLFVLDREAAILECDVPAYVNLFRQIRQRCDQIAQLQTNRPLFFESQTSVYRLRKSPEPTPATDNAARAADPGPRTKPTEPDASL